MKTLNFDEKNIVTGGFTPTINTQAMVYNFVDYVSLMSGLFVATELRGTYGFTVGAMVSLGYKGTLTILADYGLECLGA